MQVDTGPARGGAHSKKHNSRYLRFDGGAGRISQSNRSTGIRFSPARVGVSGHVEPLAVEVLAARREVIGANRRARRAAKPAYVNTDACWREGRAGLAYESGALGKRVELVACADNHEAEYLALLMAMDDADRCLSGPIHFRLDSATVAYLRVGAAGQFKDLRERVLDVLAEHPQWELVLVEGRRNRVADALSRRAFPRQARKDRGIHNPHADLRGV
jgi:ribonuclease HI